MPDGSERRYVIYIPAQYDMDPSHRWPVIVSMHGSGECGKDGLRHTRVGLPHTIAARPTRFPFITVMPQAHARWFRGAEADAVWRILEAVHEEYRTDRDRVYLTGFSMGGFGAWELAMAKPDLVAAIVPICGVAPKPFLWNIRHLPVWAFHGALDENVPVSGSREAVAELKRLGVEPKYTEYPDLGHTCWNKAYGTEALWAWLLQQRRRPPPRVIDYRFIGGSTIVWWLGVEAEKGLTTPSQIRAEVRRDGRVVVTSEGVAGWAIKSETHPLRIGDVIDVTWNGEPVYQGEFDGGFAVRLPPDGD